MIGGAPAPLASWAAALGLGGTGGPGRFTTTVLVVVAADPVAVVAIGGGGGAFAVLHVLTPKPHSKPVFLGHFSNGKPETTALIYYYYLA